MIEALKRAAQAELDNIKDPDAQFAWIVIMSCAIGIVIWALVLSS